MRSVTQPYCNTVENGCFSLRMRFFPQNFGTIKRILPGSSSPSYREGPGTEVALVHVINKQSCKDKLLMVFVRQMVLLCLKFNILFKAKHIPGVKNNLADTLSRLQVQKIRQLAPASMDRHQPTCQFICG